MQQDFIHNQNGKANDSAVTSKTAYESQKALMDINGHYLLVLI